MYGFPLKITRFFLSFQVYKMKNDHDNHKVCARNSIIQTDAVECTLLFSHTIFYRIQL